MNLDNPAIRRVPGKRGTWNQAKAELWGGELGLEQMLALSGPESSEFPILLIIQRTGCQINWLDVARSGAVPPNCPTGLTCFSLVDQCPNHHRSNSPLLFRLPLRQGCCRGRRRSPVGDHQAEDDQRRSGHQLPGEFLVQEVDPQHHAAQGE